MFCSQTCLDESFDRAEKFKSFPFSNYSLSSPLITSMFKALDFAGGPEELHEIYTDPTPRSIFDFDVSNPNDPETRRNLLKCAAALKENPFNSSATSKHLETATEQILEGLTSSNEPARTVEIIRNFVLRYTRINVCNAMGIEQKDGKHANILFVFSSLINHSCDPNVQVVNVDGSIAMVVIKPIKAGDQLFICYRQVRLVVK